LIDGPSESARGQYLTRPLNGRAGQAMS